MEKALLSKPINQENIFLECSRFGSSSLSKILGKIFMYDDKTQQLPQIDPTVPCAIFATDASFIKTEWGPMASYAIVDTFGNSYSEAPDPGSDPSSTKFELAAMKTLMQYPVHTDHRNHRDRLG